MLKLSKEDRLVFLSTSLTKGGITVRGIAHVTSLDREVVEHSISQLEALNRIHKVFDGDPASYVASLFYGHPLIAEWDSWLTSFCHAFPQFVEYDAEATTYTSNGIVILAALLADSQNADLIAHVTGFPRAFVRTGLDFADEICLWHYDNLLELRRRLIAGEPFSKIEASLHAVKENLWMTIPSFGSGLLEGLRQGHQVGGSKDKWTEEEDIRNPA
jgi:hypothetical protein